MNKSDLIKKIVNLNSGVYQKEASKIVAKEIADLIIKKQKQNKNCVLGLATGSSPISVYQELVRMHNEEGLSFKNVITFNLDEYYPMDKNDINSYHHFMGIHLFDHIDIEKKNIHIPDGTIQKEKINDYCIKYEKQIVDSGGIDFQLLGIGRTGHIGFNEPGSNYNSLTRLVHLDYMTRNDARKSFYGIENVPTTAITMGMTKLLKELGFHEEGQSIHWFRRARNMDIVETNANHGKHQLRHSSMATNEAFYQTNKKPDDLMDTLNESNRRRHSVN